MGSSLVAMYLNILVYSTNESLAEHFPFICSRP